MAPRTGKAKVHKLKGDKKKAEKVVVPVEFDIGVILPDESQLVLKGISTDRIVDVRRLLAVHVEACHITNYSLHHEVKGPRLRDAQEVLFLKPPILTLVEEDYTEEQAVANVRRLLDIFSCTTHFGASSKHQEIQVDQCPKQDLSEPARAGNDAETRSTIPSHSTDYEGSSQGVSTVTPAKTDSQEGNRDSSLQVSSGAVQDEKTTPETGEGFPATAVAAAREATERRDMSGLCPPSELKRFYEFFSLSHLTRPIQSLCRSAKQETQGQEYFVVEIRLCNGKLLTVAASAKGFRTNSKQLVQRHTLVALLKCSSQAFSKAYEELLKGFLERNKFGNIPYGLRSNTWVVPPVAADAPQVFPPTPAEDETWGGNGGGQGRAVAGKTRPWAQEFAILAKMACETVEQRRTRDRKAFRLHNLFVDVAVTVSVEVIKQWDEERGTGDCLKDDEVYQQETRNLTVTVSRDVNDASKKSEMKIDGSYLRGKTPSELAERNFLKGITADQSTTIHDIHTFGVVVVRHRGYTAVAEASGLNTVKGEDLPDDLEIEEQPEGGANALNVNSLRTLLHTGSSGLAAAVRLEVDQESAESLVHKVIENSLVGLESESVQSSSFVRLELGACWLQHLQTEGGTQETAGKTPGEGDQRQVRKLESTSEDSVAHEKHLADVSIVGDVERRSDSQEDSEAQLTLRIKLGEAAFKRLQESGTGLHLQTIPELMDGVRKYYEVALSKLVADFGSLELAPVDGRTLSDFMHARGLQMRSLGRVAELASKLPHVQSLCEHEMVARALKHVLRAVVASTEGLASAIASVFNFAFGTIPTKGGDLLWKWVEVFVRKRFNWELSESCRQDLRPYAVLRGLCHKIGIELAARDYQFECSKPIKKLDVISMVPVYKHVSCSSADARTLLESCKTALDKGKGEEAIRYGTKALAKLIAVCGPNHRMTAGAYSLLAVVLYHTGDYNQAMIYQQKALDINERELGLEHPDTIKSYGDVAVFYYRLQHTELAIKYVTRALYLLHLVCGPSHPNTAATYINVAMMEEGMGNVHVSLRYLHEALQCNVKLLGPDHTQTAATYHAMAIVLSMMDAYVLSVQHEQKTLEILENKLGKEDPRTQDSAAWLQYFDSKAVEQQEAARNGTLRTDSSIASKGHLSVPDLLEFINSEGGGKSAQSKAKSRRTKTKSKGPSVGADLFGEGEGHVSAGPPASAVNTSVEGEVMAVDLPTATIPEVSDQVAAESFARVHCELELQPEAPTVDRVNDDDGWQSAAPRGRSGSGGGRKGWRGSNSVTGAGNQAVRGIAGVMGEAAGVPDLRKASGSGTSAVYGDRTWRGVSVTRGRALSPVGNPVGNAPAEVVRKASPAVVVKLNPNTQAAVSDGAESDRKAEDGADSPADTSVKSATSTSSAASSVDGSSPRPSRAALSYKEAALAPAVAGTLAKVVSGLGGAVDIKVSKVLPSDGKFNTHVQGNNGLNNIKQTVGKTPSANADISYKASNGVADGNTDGKVAESKLVEDMDGTSEEDHLEKKSSEGKKLVAPGKRWADFDLEPTDLAECDKVTSLTTNGFGETDKAPKLNGNGQRFGRINTPTDRDGQKFGRKSYWKDVDTHGSAKGGSKAREESNGCADGHKPLAIPAKVGNGWFKSIRKESDSDSRTSQNGFGNGHSVSANASSFRKNEQQPTENGFRVVGNGSAENLNSSSSNGHEALGNRRAAVEANGPGKNGYKYGGQYSAKSADGQQSTRVKNGEKAVWNIKFGRVAESDMDIEPAGLSECDTAVPEGVVSSVETDLAVRSDSVVDSDSVHGEQPEVQEVEHIKASDVVEPQHDAVGVQLSGFGQHDVVQPSGPEQHPVEEVVVKEEDAPSLTPAMSECSGDNHSDSQDTSPNQHDSAKRLSAAAIPFTPMSTSGSRVVAAVTPFKDGKAPVPVSMSAVRPPVIPAIPNTIAVTPIRKISGLSLASPDSNNQLLGVVVPSNQPTAQFVFPPTVGNQAQLAPSVPGSIEETVSPSAHSSSMNPYAQEYIPRTMNPNAEVFIPGSAWQSISLNGGMALVSSQSRLVEVGKEDADAGLQSFGNGPFRPWEVPPMVYGEDGSFAEDLGEAQKEFSAGTGENHSSGKSLGSPGSFGGNSELEGCSEEEGCNPSVVKYENAVLFGNPPDAMGSWKQEIPCM